ncbi:DoxX family membrane protein [Rathayibacter sp. YIM 133350]|uniref:DoxX family membrane protein n=1 Tax=Rathayibacter sp. YIM 133350 TaxID=3131992 RepID=UPI00307ED7B3
MSALTVAAPLGSAAASAPTLPAPSVTATILDRFDKAQAVLQGFLARYSVAALRVSLGLVFLVFGVLKFFPGVSPVEALVERTWNALTFGMIDGYAALALTAALESIVGIIFVTGRFVRFGLLVLAATFVGIFSPLVFFFGDLFTAAGPTLTAQYILKDVVLVAAAAVVASKVLDRSRTA